MLDAHPPTALIAEDEYLLGAALAAELKRLWPELQIAGCVADGCSAVDRALDWLPDLCFLDIRMPGQSGLDAARQILDEWPLERPLPLLVFVTAFDIHLQEAMALCAIDYLLKPVLPERLAECLGSLRQRLAQRRQPSAVDSALHQLRALLATPAVRGLAPPSAWPSHLEVRELGAPQPVPGLTQRVRLPVDSVLSFDTLRPAGGPSEGPAAVASGRPAPPAPSGPEPGVSIRVRTERAEYSMAGTLLALQPRLDPARFWPVHRQVIVQGARVTGSRRDAAGRLWLELPGCAEALPCSRLYAPRFAAASDAWAAGP